MPVRKPDIKITSKCNKVVFSQLKNNSYPVNNTEIVLTIRTTQQQVQDLSRGHGNHFTNVAKQSYASKASLV